MFSYEKREPKRKGVYELQDNGDNIVIISYDELEITTGLVFKKKRIERYNVHKVWFDKYDFTSLLIHAIQTDRKNKRLEGILCHLGFSKKGVKK